MIGCGPHATTPPEPAPASTPPVVAPVAPRVRIDRPPLQLGGAASWANADDVIGMKFCPGDRELVVNEATGHLRRYRVADGRELAVTEIAASRDTRFGPVDCRGDGTAVALDPSGSPILVDASGKVTEPPRAIKADDVKLDGDAVMIETDDGLMRWAGDKVDLAVASSGHVIGSGLGEHGAFLEYVYDEAKPERSALVMHRGGARTVLPRGESDVLQVSVAPDGAVAVAGMMMAYAWTVKNAVAGPRQLLLDQSGTHIKGVAATTKWFAVMDAGGNLLRTARPAMRSTTIERPCGEDHRAAHFAIANDDARVAIYCVGAGIRILDLARGTRLDQPLPKSAGAQLAWSPDGGSLATRDDNAIQIWNKADLVKRIESSDGRGLWWLSPAELGGIEFGQLVTWTIADGVRHEIKPEVRGEVAARSTHGEIATARRNLGSDVGELAIVRGDRTVAVPLPDTRNTWLDGIAIDAAGKHGVLWRGEYNGTPALEVLDLDLAAATVHTTARTATAVALASSGYVAANGAALTWFDGTRATPIGTAGAPIDALAVHGDIVAAGDRSGTITLWSIHGDALGKLAGHSAAIADLQFAPTGLRLASTAADTTLVWDLAP